MKNINHLSDNPLLNLSPEGLPLFTMILPEHVKPAIDYCLENSRAAIKKSLSLKNSWETTVLALEEVDDDLNKTFSPIRHLHSVCNTEEMREAFDQILPELTEYQTEVGQNIQLYQAYENLKNSAEFKNYSEIQKTVVNNALRDFKLSGVHLLDKDKQRFAEIAQRLSELSTLFENNIQDATDSFNFELGDSPEDLKKLEGIPEVNIQAAREKAKSLGKAGYVFGLDFPTYLSILTYAESEELREFFYKAFNTRAPSNEILIDEILALRQEEAALLGFKNYAELSLETKMAKDPKEVLDFLYQLGDKTLSFAQKELKELENFAGKKLNSWDASFYSEKLRLALYDLSQETLRPYFPVSKVLEGVFNLIKKLFGVSFIKSIAPVWHEDVQFFELKNNQSELVGKIYLDLFAREKKRGGAWMDECHERRRKIDGTLQYPIAYLTCNFLPGVKNKEAYLTHDDVVTVFHELGHCLHHLLTKIETSALSGINGVPWDAVELPSQFLENFAWAWEIISEISEHQDTKQILPRELFNKLLETKNFQSGLSMMRQLEFSIFDFELHSLPSPPSAPSPDPLIGEERNAMPQGVGADLRVRPNVQEVLDRVRNKFSLIKPPEYNRFQNGFSHIFAGGYGAGYYSYKWAEVLSADVFSRFEEEGLFNPQVGKDFLDHILSVGGSRDPSEMFQAFRGREVSIEPLLIHSGLV